MILDCFYLKGLKSLELKSWLWWLVISRGGFGMGFFGDSQFPIPILGIADGNFSFRARSKNPRDFKSRGWESGIENPQKSQVKNLRKIPNLGDGDSWFLWPKNPSSESPKNPQFLSAGIGDFYPRDFCPGIFRGWHPGWVFFGNGNFFSWDEYPTKKPPLVISNTHQNLW